MTINWLAVINLICLAVVLLGVEHYTGHWCIALATVAGLVFLK